MSDLTIPARLVAEGVGLPAMWFEPDGCVMTRVTLERIGSAQYFERDDALVDLFDPQTAFGVALMLDAWERPAPHAARKCWPVMIARLTQIGQDHAIRRSLGWTVEPGTLAKLERRYNIADGSGIGRTGWVLSVGRGHEQTWVAYPSTTRPHIAAAGSRVQALAAIYAELAP